MVTCLDVPAREGCYAVLCIVVVTSICREMTQGSLKKESHFKRRCFDYKQACIIYTNRDTHLILRIFLVYYIYFERIAKIKCNNEI